MMIQQSYNNNLIAVIRIISYFKNQGGSFALSLAPPRHCGNNSYYYYYIRRQTVDNTETTIFLQPSVQDEVVFSCCARYPGAHF